MLEFDAPRNPSLSPNIARRPAAGSYAVPSMPSLPMASTGLLGSPPSSSLTGSALAGSSMARPPLSYTAVPVQMGSPVPSARLGMTVRSVSNVSDRTGSMAVGGSFASSENKSAQLPLWSPVRRGYSTTPVDLMGSVRNVAAVSGGAQVSPSTTTRAPTKPASGSGTGSGSGSFTQLLQRPPTFTSSLAPRTQVATKPASVLPPSVDAKQGSTTQNDPAVSPAPQFEARRAVIASTRKAVKEEAMNSISKPVVAEAQTVAPAPENVSDVAALFIAGAIRTASLDETELEPVVAMVNGKASSTENRDEDLPTNTVAAREPEGEPSSAFTLPTIRLQRPHANFPFDIFSGKSAWKNLLARGGYGLDEELVEELGYVQDHCMTPPFPWGQIIYHELVMNIVIEGGVQGDFAEFGIGLGGTSVFFARMAKKYGRKFLAVDSFEGLPEPDAVKDNHYFIQGDYCPPSGEDNYDRWMQYNSKFDVDDVLYTRKCFFKDLEVPVEFNKFAFVHLDSDLYDSVYDSLEKVWDRMPDGGIIAIDDFFHHAQGPARAVSDFFRVRCSEDEPPLLYVVPCYAVLVVKGRSACLWNPGDPESPQQRRHLMHSPRALDGNFYSFKLLRQCAPLQLAVKESVQRLCQTLKRVETDEEIAALGRCLSNAQSFLSFLRYPETASRSGSDILRYLLPLEDTWDIQQGSLCGLPGEARRVIQIQI